MPTEKRQRKREGRQARLEAERAAARQAARRRKLITAVVAGVAIFVVLLLIAGTGGNDDGDAAGNGDDAGFVYGTTPCAPVEPPAEPQRTFDDAFEDCLEDGVDYAADVVTDQGTFTIDLAEDDAPGATNNFVNLARHRYYEGATFHRVIEGFVVQGGDPVGDPPGTGGPGYTIPDEPPEEDAYRVGSVAMAKTAAPDSAGSQFFVVTGDQGVALPPEYTLFGEVTEGMDVVEAIEANPGQPPEQPAVITSVTITES